MAEQEKEREKRRSEPVTVTGHLHFRAQFLFVLYGISCGVLLRHVGLFCMRMFLVLSLSVCRQSSASGRVVYDNQSSTLTLVLMVIRWSNGWLFGQMLKKGFFFV